MTFISVDFPAPFSPSKASTSPARSSNDTPLSARTAPKDFVTLVSWSSGAAISKGNDERRMTNDERMPKSEFRKPGRAWFLFIRHSSFGFHDHPYPRLPNTSLSYLLTSPNPSSPIGTPLLSQY